ncbi:phage portal protein, HK97 family [Thalassobacillus cyri]|uniref:Phage portal protein, HK97 family n=1 Tax=Thalassobacillus cyri TaxID=571932 RepID=A0A1H4H223_9BACI|nr:phage portal protein [Thalassobacillus cyri]SEB15796.1 phage portal protein, HK97 family [Thalassobacillus cyri]
MGLKELFGYTSSETDTSSLQTVWVDLGVEYHYKNLAIQSCINLIANTLIRSKFRTFEKGKEKKSHNYYLFNVQPNQNQNSSEFFHEFVSKLVLENECLVVMQNKRLYVAESFDVKEYALFENIYKNVTIKNYQLSRSFMESEVFHFKLNNDRIKNVIDSMYASYGKLLTSAMNYYKRSNALRAKLKMRGIRSAKNEDQKKLEDMFNEQLKRFMTAENSAVLPEQEGRELEEMQSMSNSGRTSRDIRAIVDDIFDFVSMGFNIPKGLLKGDLADIEGQTDNFLMFCIEPIAELIEDEINRKFYTKEEYLARTYMKIDTSLIKYVDPVKLANALEKFLSSGTHSVNDNKRLIDEEPIDEPWAEEYFITKNYEEINKFLKGGEGK